MRYKVTASGARHLGTYAPVTREWLRFSPRAAGQRDGEDQREAVEQVVEVDRGARELQPLDAGGQQVDGDEAAEHVDAPALDLRGAQEDGRERGEQVRRTARGVARPELGGQQHTRE